MNYVHKSIQKQKILKISDFDNKLERNLLRVWFIFMMEQVL